MRTFVHRSESLRVRVYTRMCVCVCVGIGTGMAGKTRRMIVYIIIMAFRVIYCVEYYYVMYTGKNTQLYRYRTEKTVFKQRAVIQS